MSSIQKQEPPGSPASPSAKDEGTVKQRLLQPEDVEALLKDNEAAAEQEKKGGKKFVDLLVLAMTITVVLVGACSLIAPKSRDAVIHGLHWCHGRKWTSVIYLPVVVFAAVSAMPIVIFVVAAGYTWTYPLAVLVTYVGGIIGCCTAYVIGRYVLQGPLQRLIDKSDTLKGIQTLLTKSGSGWKWVLVLRLPYMPLAHVSYVLAASGVDFRTFLGTTMIGIMPGTILYCFIGTGIQSIEDFVNGKETGGALSGMIIGVVVTLILFIVLGCVSKREMTRSIAEDEVAGRVLRETSSFAEVDEAADTASASSSAALGPSGLE